jgi:hypothetical protein
MGWKYVFGFLASAVFLFLAFRKVDVSELHHALAHARYGYLVPAIAVMVVSLWLRAVRWRYLLAPIKRIGMGSLFSATAIGLMANDILPARIGEIVRAHIIGDRETISRSASLATIVVERLLDGFTLLFFLAVVLLAGMRLPGWLEKASIAAVAFYILALAGLVLLLLRTRSVLLFFERVSRPLPAALRDRLLGMLHAFANGLAAFRSSRTMCIAVLLSPLVWLPSAAIIHLLLVSLNIHLPLSVSFLLLVALCIGVMIPSAPGYIGTIQFVSVAMLALFGIPRERALSFSLVYHACIYVPVVAAGLLCLARGGVSFRDIRLVARRREQG